MNDKALKCIVLEDEPIATEKIVSYIEKTPFLENVATFNNPIEAMDWLQNNSADLAFLDIQMPELNGMEWAKITKNDLLIIFTTAYDKYAIEGYKVNAIDYLLKPFSYTEFYTASQKAFAVFKTENTDAKEKTNYIFLKSGSKKIRINFTDIKYFKGADDYVEVVTNIKSILADIRFSELIKQLPKGIFTRVHRSYIVNQTKIDFIERNRIIIDNERIPISETYRDNIRF